MSDGEETRFVTVGVGSGVRATEDPCAGFLFRCDSRAESLLDRLTACGRLVDDAAAGCQWAGVQYERGDALATTSVLEEWS
jgi:hypothetical protein